MNNPNWPLIKQALKENFVDTDFEQYSTSSFKNVNFDIGLEHFRFVLEKEIEQISANGEVFNAINNLLIDGVSKKELVRNLALNLENYLKKIFTIIGKTYTTPIQNPYDAPTLSWCFEQVIQDKTKASAPKKEKQFYHTSTISNIGALPYKVAKFNHKDFSTFLADNTVFGKSLHFAYHNRNAHSHNNPKILQTEISDFYQEYLRVYLYFTFKYHAELSNAISTTDLQHAQQLTLKKLSNLAGGAYNPEIINEIKRENIAQTISKKLKNLNVIFLEGEEGIGKTTILHQFVAINADCCFAYFLDNKDSSTYSNISILQAFCNQLHFVSLQKELTEQVDVNNYNEESWLKNYFTRAVNNLTHSHKKNQTFFFLIDGIDEITNDRRNEIKEQILDAIPYNKENIKLVLTGKQNQNLLKSDANFDKFEMPLLSKEDSRLVLGNTVNQAQFQEVNKICENNAGKIVFFRDLIKTSGIPVENIINNLSSDFKGLYNYLWNNHFKANNTSELILAIITFQEQKYGSESITKLINKNDIDENKIIEIVRKIPFVRQNARGTYEYIFDDFKTFAEKKLSKYKNYVDQVVIDYLINNLHSFDSLVLLPEMYRKTGKTDELIALLNNEKWNQLLRESEKISVVSRISKVALQTIQDKNENKYIPTILKYSVLKSALKELSQTTVWQKEIATNLVLGEYIDAINLADIAFLKEDKLKMFASIAKAHIEKGNKVPENIDKKIIELYEDIDSSKDFKNVKEAGMEIASLLMYSNPKLAFRLIEELSGSITDNDNAFDWALAQISLSVHTNLSKLSDVSKEDINTKVYSKIRNPKIKEFADAILHLSENQSSEEIIGKINQLESTSQKMFLIRNWINRNIKDDKIANVIDIGLALAVNKSDKYIPKASDYKIFAMPLPYLKDREKTYELIKQIEQYTASIENISTTNDLLTIELLTTRAICNFDFDKGEERLFEIFNKISNLSDLATKCSCLAVYANEATIIKNIHKDKNLNIYLESARNGIESNIDEILSQTASHFEIVQNIITNLVKLYPDDAIQICKKLNKAIDRDNAFLEALASYLKQGESNIDINYIDILLDSINDLDIKKLAISEIINGIDTSTTSDVISKYFKYFDKVDCITDNRTKCILYVNIVSILEKSEKDNESFIHKLNKTWNELEKSIYKIELGFEIAYSAAFLQKKELSKNFLDLAKKEKDDKQLLLDSPNTTQIFGLTIDLAIRIFSGLIISEAYTKNDILNIEKSISSLPSEGQQIKLWSSLVLRIIPKLDVNSSLHTDLIKDYIIPKLAKIKNKNERIDAILESVVALYFADKSLQYLLELPSVKMKDIALSRVCNYLFTKCPPTDICEANGEGYSIDFNLIKDIIHLTKQMTNDYFIASQIIEIRKSITSKNTIISSQQRIDIKNEFESIANTKLPDNNNIRHLGYQILINANALCIQSKTKWQEWMKILSDIDNIPNLSDRIFMWISVTELLPQEFNNKKLDLINKAEQSVYLLPSFFDTVERLNMIFVTLNEKQVNGIGLKHLLEKFISFANKNPQSPFLRENYRDILDVAYNTDPIIAKTFVNTFDKDNARQNTGSYLNNHLNLLEFQSKIEKSITEKSEQQLLEGNTKYFNKVIEKRLAKLNATKIVKDKLSPRDLIYQLKIASENSIHISHTAFSYFIERLIIMYESTEESDKIIRKSFLELLDVCDLVKLLSIRNADKIQSLLDVISVEDNVIENIEDLEAKIGGQKYTAIVELLEKNISPNDISLISGIDIEDILFIESDIKAI